MLKRKSLFVESSHSFYVDYSKLGAQIDENICNRVLVYRLKNTCVTDSNIFRDKDK